MKNVRVGDRVAVCYDGKWSRAVEGRVTKVLRSHKKPRRITIRFLPWANEESGFVDIVCRKLLKSWSYAGMLVGNGEHGIMRRLGVSGDWYSICPIEDLFKAQYKVESYDRPAPDDGFSTAKQVVRRFGNILTHA